MAYFVIVALTMVILPVGSISIEAASGQAHLLWLVGKWFVSRLLIAGVRQYLKPEFTARELLGIEGDDALLVVRELGGANMASGVVALASIAMPTFVLPSAIGAGIFYAVAAAEHVKTKQRGRNESIAMISDFFVAAVLLAFAVGALAEGLR